MDKMIRPCGFGWAYCDGKCTGCSISATYPATSETVPSGERSAGTETEPIDNRRYDGRK